MELTNDDIAQLEAYWENRLLAPEKTALKKRLEEDPPFKEAADQLFKVKLTLEEIQVRAWMAEVPLEDVFTSPNESPVLPDQGHVQPLKIVSAAKRQWVKWAAASVGLFGAGALLYQVVFRDPVQQFISDEFKAPPSRGNVMSDPNYSEKAMELYDKQRYEEAIPVLQDAFEELITDKNGEKTKDSIQLYYMAVCLIATDQPSKAIEILEEMKGSDKAKDPHWFLALAYLKQKNYQKARENFNLCKESSNGKLKERAEKGIAMLDKLNL